MTDEDMAALTEGATSKSAKVRALAAAGVATAEIARFLGISYHFAYNVIRSAALQRTPDVQLGSVAELSLEDLIRVAHAKGFAVTFHPLNRS